MKPIQVAVTVFMTILGTGALLNLAGQGKLGMTVKNAASYVTDGYGSINN